MNFLKKNCWWKIGIGIALVAAVIAFHPTPFQYDSYCSICGAERDTTEWQVQGHEWTLSRFSSEHATLLSKYVSSSGLVTEHAHDWLFAHGGGNGVRCALGSGDALRDSVNCSNIVQLIQWAKECDSPTEARKILRLSMDPDISRSVLWMAALIPTNGFSDGKEYRSWKTENSSFVEDAVAAKAKKF